MEEGKLLVIDDQHYETAKKYFESVGIDVDVARDYNEATQLGIQNYSGVITDCFFPEETGSGKREKGEKILENIAQEFGNIGDPNISALGRRLIQEIDIDDYITKLTDEEKQEKMNYFIPLAREMLLENTFEEIDLEDLKEKTMEGTKYTPSLSNVVNTFFSYISRELLGEQGNLSEIRAYDKMAENLAKSENNQPLGILISEEARKVNIPAFIATDTHHHDGVYVTVRRYLFAKGKKEGHTYFMKDIPGDKILGSKAELNGWEKAYGYFKVAKRNQTN
jgi:hypothetical protein